jgi:hypothetical protein
VFDFSSTLSNIHFNCFLSDDLRRRFVKAETILFKVRYDSVLMDDREEFLDSREFNWVAVSVLRFEIRASI